MSPARSQSVNVKSSWDNGCESALCKYDVQNKDCYLAKILLLLGREASGTPEILNQCSKDDIFIAVLLIVLYYHPFLGKKLGDNLQKLSMCLFFLFLKFLWNSSTYKVGTEDGLLCTQLYLQPSSSSLSQFRFICILSYLPLSTLLWSKDALLFFSPIPLSSPTLLPLLFTFSSM